MHPCRRKHAPELEKQIEKFRIREVKELEKLEKISLREKRDDYAGLQQRIEKLKENYRIIRDQKIKERVEALGVKLQGDEDRETLLQLAVWRSCLSLTSLAAAQLP